MKYLENFILALTMISLLGFIQPTQANLNNDTEIIFNDAQEVYPKYFPSKQNTQLLNDWKYRYYPSTNIYLGINNNDKGVYVLGGLFGDEILYVNDKEEVKLMLKKLKQGFNFFCDNTPGNATCEQNGYNINQSTNGECIILENNNLEIIETGINTLSNIENPKFQLSGIDSNSLDFSDFIYSLEQDFIDQFDNHCVIHTQGNNIPNDLSNYKVNRDICLDITSSAIRVFESTMPGVNITPPVTMYTGGDFKWTIVPDCFSTNATIITNSITKESWFNVDGVFIKKW